MNLLGRTRPRFRHFYRDSRPRRDVGTVRHSTENVATTRSPTDNTVHGVTEKPAMSSSFSERVKNTFRNFFAFNMGTGSGDEAETQEEEEEDDEQDDFGSQVSLNSSTQEIDAYTEEALSNLVGSIGEQNEQMSLRMSELERAGHVERENLQEEINRNRQEVSRSDKCLKERTGEHLAKNLSRMTREALPLCVSINFLLRRVI